MKIWEPGTPPSQTLLLLLGMAGGKLLLCFAPSWAFGNAAGEICLPMAEKAEWGPMWAMGMSALQKTVSRHYPLGRRGSEHKSGKAGWRQEGREPLLSISHRPELLLLFLISTMPPTK